jgi:hypothetical protein
MVTLLPTADDSFGEHAAAPLRTWCCICKVYMLVALNALMRRRPLYKPQRQVAGRATP